jgi:hypothetical protein
VIGGRDSLRVCPCLTIICHFERKEKETMKNIKNIKIIIKQVEGREGEYIAYYKSDFLDATYSVYFRDNMMGFVAFHSFSEMIKGKYGGARIDFEISDEKMQFKSKALLEVMTCSRVG